MSASALSLFAALGLLAPTPAGFQRHWHDRRAEIDGYRLVQPRYGQARAGSAVMVWVTEPFSASKHVKLDRPAAAGPDLAPVMKLNLLRRFKTGIYDYNLMLSVFSPLVFDRDDALAQRALKVTFSAQEWCGHVFHQLDAFGDTLQSQWRSYFEAEGDGSQSLALPAGTLLEDELWFRLRGLARPLEPGAYKVVSSLQSVRLAHVPLAIGQLEITRAARSERTRVPAGVFETVRHDLTISWGQSRPVQRRTLWIEKAYPHRIIAWQGDVAGLQGNEPVVERAELTGTIRDTYWEHNRLGDERLRSALGLPE